MLNPEKSRQLRPLRTFLAVLFVVLFILVLDRLPTTRTVVKSTTATSVDSSESPILSADEISDNNPALASSDTVYFCTFTSLLSELESSLEDHLTRLGVPEEDFSHPQEYLSKDELYNLELKASLAASLELSPVRATLSELKALSSVLVLSDADLSACNLTEPKEYNNLSDLLSDYYTGLNTSEDYDEAL